MRAQVMLMTQVHSVRLCRRMGSRKRWSRELIPRAMQRLGLALSLAVLVLAGTAFAQSSSSSSGSSGSDAPSSFYPAPPPKKAPEVDTGAPVTNLTSPLAADQIKPTRTAIDSEAEAETFAHASRIVWGRYSRIKGAKPGA